MIQGKRKWFYAETEREADQKAKGARPAPTPTFDAHSFAAFVYGPWKANVWPEAREKTRTKYNGMLKAHILPILGPVSIAHVGLEDMQRLKGSLVLKGHKTPGEALHPRTVHSVLTLTRSILALARAAGKTHRQDWQLVSMPKFEKKRERIELPDDFTAKLIAASEGRWMAGPLFAALFLGLREGEVCGLKWSAIDREKLTVRIDTQRQRAKGGGSADAPTKGKPRVLHVDETIIRHLDRLGDKGSIYLFTGGNGFPMRPDRLLKQMTPLCKLAGVPRVTFHDLRSHAATNLAAIGADPLAIMSILGHTKIDVTMLYIDVDKKKIREALTKLVGAKMEAAG